MVQILDPTIKKERFSQALGQGLAQGIPAFFGGIQQRQQKKEKERFTEQAAGLLGIDPEKLKGIPAETIQEALKSHFQSMEKENLFKKKSDYFAEKFRGKQGMQGQQSPQGIMSPEFGGAFPGQQDNQAERLQGFDPTQMSAEDLAEATMMDPNLGRMFSHEKDVGLREAREGEKLEYKKSQDIKGAREREVSSAKKETLPLRKEIADKAKFARQLIANKKSLRGLLDKGKIDSPYKVYLAGLLPGALGNTILSPDTQVYRSGLFDEFGVIKQMFPGAVRVKELELLEDKLATLDKSDEAKRQILDVGIKKLEADQIISKAAREVEKESPDSSLLDFEEKVYERAQPRLDALYDEMRDDYEKIFIKNAPAESKFTDQEGREYKVKKDRLADFLKGSRERGLEMKVKK